MRICYPRLRSLVLTLALLVWSYGAECVAQQTTTPSTTLSESLSEEVNDPTATPRSGVLYSI